MNRMRTETSNFTSSPARKIISVIQGEVEVSDDPTVILSTILGSCVAVCMWDAKARVGGMNHFLLAQGHDSSAIKYGAHAMEVLINRLLRVGAQRNSLQSKLFGGAAISGFTTEIGLNNAQFAQNFLKNEGIACAAESLGGKRPRRVRFIPTVGSAQVLFVEPTEVAAAVPMPISPKADITLF